MLLTFGIHKGKELSTIDSDYLKWLSKPKYSGKFYENSKSTELNWSVPFTVKLEARKELESRGYELIGETWYFYKNIK